MSREELKPQESRHQDHEGGERLSNRRVCYGCFTPLIISSDNNLAFVTSRKTMTQIRGHKHRPTRRTTRVDRFSTLPVMTPVEKRSHVLSERLKTINQHRSLVGGGGGGKLSSTKPSLKTTRYTFFERKKC